MRGFSGVSFFATVLTVWVALHAYVVWRTASIPIVAAHVPRIGLIAGAILLGSSYLGARIAEHFGAGLPGRILEFVGAAWMGVLFLLFASLLLADVVTGFGYLLPRAAGAVRGWALLLAGLLSVVAAVQGLRAPVVREQEVRLPGLPAALDGTVVALASDLHLGTLIGEGWLTDRIGQIDALKPDVVVLCGDILEGDGPQEMNLLPVLRSLRAPLGVFAVTGNHEFYAGLEKSVRFLEEAGFTVLRDRAVEVRPGLVLAGVDDLTARRQRNRNGDPVRRALEGRPAGATLFLSHTPWQAERAAAAGAGLMLSGHTHAGQIWPFGWLVRLNYPLLAGRYEVAGMTVIVGRGTGTWGPRMRLWRPGEIVRITLRSPATAS
jgi:predicted MPP superfamily phosphohydrolase